MIAYARAWNVAEQRPEHALTESEARACHETGERYSALIGDGDLTEKVITLELGIGVVTARFLDRLQRVALVRVYAQRAGDRVFGEWTAFYNYADDDLRGTRPLVLDTTTFGKDGSWRTSVQYVDGYETSTGFVLDVADRWESVPAFGDYESIGRYD